MVVVNLVEGRNVKTWSHKSEQTAMARVAALLVLHPEADVEERYTITAYEVESREVTVRVP